MKKIVLFWIFAVFCTADIFAQRINWNFNTDSNYEGWYDFDSRISSNGTHNVTNGVLSYTIQALLNPQWRIDAVDFPRTLDAAKDYIFEVQIRRTSGTAAARTKLFINAIELGTINLENNNEWQTLTFNYTGGTAAVFSFLRFDPTGGQNGSWEIDSIKVYDPSAPVPQIKLFLISN